MERERGTQTEGAEGERQTYIYIYIYCLFPSFRLSFCPSVRVLSTFLPSLSLFISHLVPGVNGCTRTLNPGIMRRVFYHCQRPKSHKNLRTNKYYMNPRTVV